ncbi:UDP-glucose 4-epimerase, partial [Aureobasidium melanogenum]
VRDYIHVSDLAMGHLAALRKATKQPDPVPEGEEPYSQDAIINYNVYNLGTGRGYSVLEIIKAFSNAAGTSIPFTVGEARAGDLGTVTASPEKAASDLDWRAEFDLQDMCRDVFNWAAANPTGYETLRRLSTMSGMSGSEMRRQSVATGLFEREEDFDSFIVSSLNSIDHSSPTKDNSGRRRSSYGINFTGMLKKVCSTSAEDDDESHFGGNYALSSGQGPGHGAAPRFTMAWGETHKTETIVEGDEEEEDLDLGPTYSPSTSKTLPVRSK